jgi:pSer/pThr/pTyr-binding forkhead associated (FHA) protein
MTGFFLIRGEDPQSGERIELTPQMLVGRSDECDLRVTEGHPSRRHARLSVDADGLWVEDLGSANGTRVNGTPITARTLLRNGDSVAFDLSVFIVDGPPPPPAAGGDATVVRAMPTPDATVVRAPPSGSSATPPKTAPHSAASAPASAPLTEAEALQKQVPRSWADPEFQGEGTRILSAEEMRALATGGSTAGATGTGEAPAPTYVEGAHLVILAGPGAGTAFPLGSDREEWSIGTAAERDLRLDYAGVSAFHAKISHEGGRWRIIDQMSANGTWVNGQKSTISYLQNGDKLRFAQVECEIRLPTSASAGGRRSTRSGGANRLRPALIALGVAIATGIALYFASQLL